MEYRLVTDRIRKLAADGFEQIGADAVDISNASIEQRLEGERNATDYRIDLETRTQSQLQEFREAGLSAAVGLAQSQNSALRAIGQVAFAYQKAKAIAEAAIATRGAIMETYRRLGYPWGVPAAIAVGALGAAQIAGIATSSIGGGPGSGIGSGSGSAPSTPSNSVYADSSDERSEGASSQRVLQIILQGNNYGVDRIKEVITEAVKEYIDIDGIIIQQGSRQAIELGGS